MQLAKSKLPASSSNGDIGGEEAKRLKTHGSPSKVEGVVGGSESASTAQQSHAAASGELLNPAANGELTV